MMKKIPEGYKETELGVIPQEWEIQNLMSITKLIKDGSHGTHEDVEEGIPLLSAKDIVGNKILIPSNCRKISKDDFDKIHKSYSLELEDLLLTIVGTIGRSAIVKDVSKEYTFQRSVAIIKLKNTGMSNFVKSFFDSSLYQSQLKSSVNASAQGGVYLKTLSMTKIILPTLPEQQKIAEILSSVDEHIEKLDETISEYELLKKGMMKKLLTEGIGHTEFKDTELGRIPKEWEVRKLGEVCDIVSGGTPKTDKIEYWENGDILWATPTDITTNGKYISSTAKTITKLGLQNSSARLVPSGSILMTSRATIGERSINTIEMSTNQGFKVLICKDSMYNEYIYYYIDILLPEILKNSSGSTFKEISKAKTENLLLSIPPLSEQQQIAYILSSIDERIDLYKSEKDDFMQVKKGLMEKLLTGKIRV